MATEKSDAQKAIIVDNVSKSFHIPLDGSNSLKQKVINGIKRRKGYRNFTPLKNISFSIDKGEFFGIVGRNGSGKSTLLKTIAGIYSPDTGSVKVNGLLVPFIELGVGFNPELTGRENVFLNGALLGFGRKEMEAMYDEIVDFAELHDFMEEQLKNYSSGMQVRLAFSIAIRARGDILLLDEVLAVGDQAFQRKCYEYFAELKKQRKTVILVTHSMESVQRFCSSAMLIDGGKILRLGDPMDVAEGYRELNQPPEKEKNVSKSEGAGKNQERIELSLTTGKGKSTKVVTGKDAYFEITSTIIPKETIKDAFFGITIRKQSGELVYWYTTEPPHDIIDSFPKNKPTTISLKIDNIFGESGYVVGVYLKSNDRAQEYIAIPHMLDFKIVNRGINGSMLHPQVSVAVKQ